MFMFPSTRPAHRSITPQQALRPHLTLFLHLTSLFLRLSVAAVLQPFMCVTALRNGTMTVTVKTQKIPQMIQIMN